jgi:hypothetical protein
MKSVTVFRSIFLSLLVSVFILSEANAQEPRRTSGSATIKDGARTTTTSPTTPAPSAPAPVYRPGPDEKQTSGQNAPAPVYRPAPNDRAQIPAPLPPTERQPSTIDRDDDGDDDRNGEISKDERKRMKEIRKAEKKRARELRKADHKAWVEQHKREKADQGLEARSEHMKGSKGHGKGKH